MIKSIGFYGHSNCAYRSDYSFIDLIAQHYNADIVNIGVRQGSEERILYELKKTKRLDLAIIFHSHPNLLFLPHCDRDIYINSITQQRVDYLFRNFDSDNPPKFIQKFKNQETFLSAYETYRQYFYLPELQQNRYYGSLIQIDQYLTYKNIKAIHVINQEQMPNWFKFQSGLVDSSILSFVKDHQDINKSNLYSEKGNRIVYERLTELVEELFPLSSGAVT